MSYSDEVALCNSIAIGHMAMRVQRDKRDCEASMNPDDANALLVLLVLILLAIVIAGLWRDR